MEAIKLNHKNLDNWNDKPITAARDDEYTEVAWGLKKAGGQFEAIRINRAKVRENDVKVDMQWSGVCHTDVHIALNELGGTMFPCIPGHELMGVVEEVGAKVTKVKVGDKVGVGCLVDKCGDCKMCTKALPEEQYCPKGWCHIYNDTNKYGNLGGNPDAQTHGGYTASHVVGEHFVMKVPDNMDMEKAAPLLCAGVTMWDPLRHHGMTTEVKDGGEKKTVGVIGLGGLGTMGVKLAAALGHRVVAISTSANKEAMAMEKGATDFVCSKDEASMAKLAGTCDLIMNTVAAPHEVAHYIGLLCHDGAIVQLGVIADAHTVSHVPLIFGRKSISGSLIGGIKSTEDCLAFCDKHNIYPDTQTIVAKQLDWSFDQLCNSNKDGIRYVIDIKKSLQDKDFMA